MMRQLLLWGSQNPWLSQKLPRYRFVQRAVRRFIPGEELEAALTEAARFQEPTVATIVTQLGENVTDEAEAEVVARHYADAIDRIEARGVDTEVSVKLTQLGLDLNPETAYQHTAALARQAAPFGKTVWIDMEGSAYLDATLDLFRRLCQEHRNVGLCLQAYLYRTADDLDSLLPLAPTIRLVKGAYAEPPEIAFPKKADVDANFFLLAQRLLDADLLARGARPAFATHDTHLVRRICEEAEARSIDRSAYEFQMLYGIRRQEQNRLIADGYRLRVLISYGQAWFPWYMRRLAERPANLWFVMKSLFS